MAKKVGSALTFNVRDFGAKGEGRESARKAIQKAIEACAKSGGGIVYFPPGFYITGTIKLESNVRVIIESGAMVFAGGDGVDIEGEALFWGENCENVSLEGRGCIDGRGKSTPRPSKTKTRGASSAASHLAHLLLFDNCRDVRVSDLILLHSPSATVRAIACDGLELAGLRIRTSREGGAAGVDLDCSSNAAVSHCRVETGGDALVFHCSVAGEQSRPCRNITVLGCRLSSSSTALSFSDPTENAIRGVIVDDCLITDSARGFSFSVSGAGRIEDVLLSNLIVECTRIPPSRKGEGNLLYFHVGGGDKAEGLPMGRIKNIGIINVMARATGESAMIGHADSPLEDIRLENVRLELGGGTEAKPDAPSAGLRIRWAHNLRIKDVEILWEEPVSREWWNSLVLEDVADLELDGLKTRQPMIGSEEPAVIAVRIDGAIMRGCKALEGTGTFLEFAGEKTKAFFLMGNDLRRSKIPFTLSAEVSPKEVREK